MKKLLALSGIGSSVTFGVMTSVAVPKAVLIALVMFLQSLPGGPSFATSSSSLAGIILDFARDFFAQGGITTAELIIGL